MAANFEDSREYIIEIRTSIEDLKRRYPNFRFTPLASGAVILEAPADLTEELEALRQEVTIFYLPQLYGLNAEEGLNDTNVNFLHNYPLGELRGQGILLGFIDTGIDYQNDLFLYEDNTTRINYLWDQTIEGRPPTGYYYGTEYSASEIDQALKSSNPLSIVPSQDEIGHGTFLAGVAGGNDRIGESGYIGAAPDAEFIVVKLRPASAYWRDFYLLEPDAVAYQNTAILQGINYMINKATELKKPLAICIGLGSNQGPHNGSSGMGHFLQNLSMAQDIVLATAAGNEANKGHHYSGMIQNQGIHTIEINVGADEAGFILQLWASNADRLTMSITTPLGEVVEKVPISIRKPVTVTFPLEKTTIEFQYENNNPVGGVQLIAVRLKEPTAGLWNFTVYGEYIIEGKFNVWLPRESFITDATRFTKSDTNTTVCEPGTAKDIIVVGGYDYVDQSIYAAGGRGPTTDNVIKPDFIAPCTHVRGPRPGGGFTTYTGTSVAAAITTGANALLLQWAARQNPVVYMNTRVARMILIRGAKRTRNQSYPNNIEGYGKLDLKNSILLS